ncbi:MAG: leucyl aminopeptidase [Bacteriovoracia bacterium]
MARLPSLDIRTSAGASEAEVVLVFQDAGKKAVAPKGSYEEAVSRLRRSGPFAASVRQSLFIRMGGRKPAESVLFAGLGQASEVTEEKFRQAGAAVWARLNAEKCKSAFVRADAFTKGPYFKAFAEGLLLSSYRFDKHKSQKASADASTMPKIHFIATAGAKAKFAKELARAYSVAEAVFITRDWSNEPSNFGTPEYYASEAVKYARKFGLRCRILSERDAKRERMGLFLAVGQGSDREGKIVVIEHRPRGKAAKNAKTIAFVGKGITFDSGGISIKPSKGMEDMKHDMTGAATMMGAVVLASLWNVPNRVVGILAFTENMPNGIAVQPGNVIRSRAGKTVEIINTDAEGRLILADVLDYAHTFKPDVIVNSATLTGAVGVALGRYCCGLMGNDDALIEQLKAIGDSQAERMWQLPMYDEYFDDMKSDVADMRNSCNNSYGGTIRGGIFLKQFIKKGFRWAHLDIASTCYDLEFLPYAPRKGASGSFVRSLATFAAEF